jgi:hypothetical protein
MKYHGTDCEVMLGDRVMYRHLLFGRSKGIVAYLPGVSEVNSRIEFNGGQQWVVKLTNGKGVFMVFHPGMEFAHPRILFVERGGSESVIKPGDVI